MMDFKNILIPWDGSKFSLHAFKVALGIAQKYNSKITVIHCIEGGEYRGPWYTDTMFTNTIRKKQTKIANSEIKKLALMAKNATIAMHSEILFADSTVKQIISYAKSKKIDLIVMGSHGRKGWNKMVLGSVANGVSQNAPCSVIIAR